jgi:hypothetical protein
MQTISVVTSPDQDDVIEPALETPVESARPAFAGERSAESSARSHDRSHHR